MNEAGAGATPKSKVGIGRGCRGQAEGVAGGCCVSDSDSSFVLVTKPESELQQPTFPSPLPHFTFFLGGGSLVFIYSNPE